MKNISELINEWDPIELFPYAPKDEYISEIKEIEKFVMDNKNISVTELAKVIDNIFCRSFGEGTYESNPNNSMKVAERILSDSGRNLGNQL